MIEDQIKTTTRRLLIRGGTLIDGTGATPFRGDVLVVGDRIEHIGDVEPATAQGAEILDATGTVVTPGFINILSHAYDSIQEDPRAASDILQGVTTEIFGEGLSPGPVKGRMSEHFPVSEEGQTVRPFWSSLKEFLDHLEHRGVAVNVASFVGFANLRLAVAGYDNRPLTPAEVAEMSEILAAELADGALGLGSALVYPPESYSEPAELIELGHTLHQHDALYISHLRHEDHRLLEGIDELLGIARSSGVRAEVFHLKSLGKENWPLVLDSLDRIEQARAEGLDITADIYPYRASATYLQTIVPQKYHEGGRSRLTERLTSPAIRAQVEDDILHGTTKNMYRAAGGPMGLLLLGDAPGFADISGRYLGDLAMEMGRDALDLALDITAAKPDLMVAYFCGTEENARLAFSRPWVSVGSDAEAVAAAPAPSQTPVHPRAYGTFARILGQYVREEGLVPLEEAIRRMTSLPADTLRLSDRGRLVPGAAADIVVFDAATIKDHATYEQPHQYADGMIHVVVNGVVTVRDGAFTGHFGGRALRRSPQTDPTPSSRSERNNVHVID